MLGGLRDPLVSTHRAIRPAGIFCHLISGLLVTSVALLFQYASNPTDWVLQFVKPRLCITQPYLCTVLSTCISGTLRSLNLIFTGLPGPHYGCQRSAG